MTKNATLNNFNNIVLNSSKPVLAVFCASSCRLCATVEPVVEMFESEFAGRIDFVRIDLDEVAGLKTLYEIKTRPTMILFVDGDEVTRFTGPPNGVAIREALEAATKPVANC